MSDEITPARDMEYTELREHVRRLHALMADPQPGLSTWRQAVRLLAFKMGIAVTGEVRDER